MKLSTKHRLQNNNQRSSSKNPHDSGIEAINQSLNRLSDIMGTFIKSQLVSHSPSNAHGPKESQTDQRFKHHNILVPYLNNNLCESERNTQIEVFIGDVCKQVLEHGFVIFKKGEFDTQQFKVYCCENILGPTIQLINLNGLAHKQVAVINDCLKNSILPYFSCKYPISNEKGANSQFDKAVISRDNIDEQADLIFKSQIKFRWNEAGNYNSDIMKFLNQVVEVSNSNHKSFELQMKDFFQLIYDQGQTVEMMEFNPRSPTKEKDIETIKKIRQLNIIDQQKTNIKNHEIQKNKLEYKDKVKTYTSYRIGKKLPDSITKFSQEEIIKGNLHLNDPSIIRIVTKWCEQLESIYLPHAIVQRQKAFRMRDGGLNFFEYKWQNKMLEFLLKMQKIQIDLYLESVREHSNFIQSEYGRQNINKKLEVFSKNEAKVGSFAANIYMINKNYLEGFINKLIHGITTSAKLFQFIISNDQLYVGELQQIRKIGFNDEIGHKILQKAKISPFNIDHKDQYIPELIIFRVGDLLRCKCSSKQKQIIALYREIEKKNLQNPDRFKIMRIKNRLNKGTKDILINFLFNQKLLVEMQLAIKSESSKFIECSSEFAHYLYELQRSQFGPISEMCNIWVSKDPRSTIFLNEINFMNTRQNKNCQLSCCDRPALQSLEESSNMPFRCGSCKFMYFNPQQSGQQQNQMICQKCLKKVCFMCKFQSMDADQKSKVLKIEKAPTEIIFQRNQSILQAVSKIPKIGYIKNLKQIDEAPIKFFRFKTQNTVYLLEYPNQEHRKGHHFRSLAELNITIKIDKNTNPQIMMGNINGIRKFLIENVILSANDQQQIDEQFIKQNFIIQRYLKECDKKMNDTITIIGQGISDEVFRTFFRDLVRRQQYEKGYIKKLILSENRICDISRFPDFYPNLQELIINHNKISKFPDNGQKWKALKLLQLKDNQLNDPTELLKISQFSHLQVLRLTNNKLNEVPPWIDKLQKLKKLYLSNNSLKKLPNSSLNIDTLQILSLYQAELDQLPEKFGNMKNLISLNLQSNYLKALPQSFGNMSELRILNIEYNQIRELPKSISKLTKLLTLNMSRNKLICLPDDIGSINKVKTIYASNNEYEKIPESLGELTNIRKISIFNNKVQTLPEGIFNLKNFKFKLTLSYLNPQSKKRLDVMKKQRGWEIQDKITQ